jgi:hypothetical protein
MKDAAQKALRMIAEKHGSAALLDAKRCGALLRDHCPHSRREISVLVTAIENGVSRRFANAAGPIVEPMIATATAQFSDDTGMEKSIARWAVEAFAHALGFDVAPAQGEPGENFGNKQPQTANSGDQSKKPESTADRGSWWRALIVIIAMLATVYAVLSLASKFHGIALWVALGLAAAILFFQLHKERHN